MNLIKSFLTSKTLRKICYFSFSFMEELPMEIIKLQCESAMKKKYSNVDIGTFYQYVGPYYPQLKSLVSKIMSLFGTMYVCEQLFSIMNLNK